MFRYTHEVQLVCKYRTPSVSIVELSNLFQDLMNKVIVATAVLIANDLNESHINWEDEACTPRNRDKFQKKNATHRHLQ